MRHLLSLAVLAGLGCLQTAQAKSYSITASSAGVVYDSFMPSHFGGAPFPDGTPYTLQVRAIVDQSQMSSVDPILYTFRGAYVKAVFTFQGQSHTFLGRDSIELSFAPDSFDPRFIAFAGETRAGDDVIWFTHNFSLPKASYPGTGPLDSVNLDLTGIATEQQAVVTLLQKGNPTGRIYGTATTLQYTVSPVPEPVAAAMLLGGIGLFGGIAVRRRRPLPA